MDYKADFITFMARSGALTFGDFQTKSGRQTPYFINTGNYNTGWQISSLGGFYADCITSNLTVGQNTVLFGPAYKGISLAVSTSIALAGRGINTGYCFNRKETKDHGEGGALVGHNLTQNTRVIIIEDVITAGTAVREVLPIFNRAGCTVDALIISVNRLERGTGTRSAISELWEDHQIPTYAIVDVQDILSTLHNTPIDGKLYIDDHTAAKIRAYMNEYCET